MSPVLPASYRARLYPPPAPLVAAESPAFSRAGHMLNSVLLGRIFEVPPCLSNGYVCAEEGGQNGGPVIGSYPADQLGKTPNARSVGVVQHFVADHGHLDEHDRNLYHGLLGLAGDDRPCPWICLDQECYEWAKVKARELCAFDSLPPRFFQRLGEEQARIDMEHGLDAFLREPLDRDRPETRIGILHVHAQDFLRNYSDTVPLEWVLWFLEEYC